MYTSILVPLDVMEDELSHNALKHAVGLAKLTGATLHLLHVLPISTTIINAYELGYLDLKDKASTIAEERLALMAKEIDLPKDRVSYSIAFGSTRDEIVEATDTVQADLIVIGSHRPNIKTHLLGSNASGIVRYAKTSVLVVR
ncbi:Universal stress protein G [Leminorella richardii]|uniref:Universal stress protein n=1 Tax=Leminorella richardii TaxID=158841 RepID=A0A2X4ULZ5_9GAMM|nr:universal stress protein [Leminorella richardii]SQI40926.1 Universal stress protein G [Leminorella richardii]